MLNKNIFLIQSKKMSNLTSKIIGVGGYLPNKIITNFDLEKMVETTDEWITQRTGIHQRHIAEGQATSDLAVEAVKKAIKNDLQFLFL